jgi:hypothetical protein
MKFKEGDHIVLIDPNLYISYYRSGVVIRVLTHTDEKYVIKYDDMGICDGEYCISIDEWYKLSLSDTRNAKLKEILKDEI